MLKFPALAAGIPHDEKLPQTHKQNSNMDLTKLSNEELGQLFAQVILESGNRESDEGFNEAALETLGPPKSEISCADNFLKCFWLSYIRIHGAYVAGMSRNTLAYEKALALKLP